MTTITDLPAELFEHIVNTISQDDLKSAISLLNSCQLFRQSGHYGRIRYLHSVESSGFPLPKRLPFDIPYDTCLLQRSRWPYSLEKHERKWIPLPEQIDGVALSQSVKLSQDRLYIRSSENDKICCLRERREHLERQESSTLDSVDNRKGNEADSRSHDENFTETLKIQTDYPIVSFDVDSDAGVLAALVHTPESLLVVVYSFDDPKEPLATQSLARPGSYNFMEIVLNKSTVLISLDNEVHTRSWAPLRHDHDMDECMPVTWSRPSSNSDQVMIRASLLSSTVVACINAPTSRCRDGRDAVVELYRLDQQVPRVADISISFPYLGWRGNERSMTYVTLGGKHGLEECRNRGRDGIALISIRYTTVCSTLFRELRLISKQWVGKISTFCEVLYPKAALALFSTDTTTPSHPVLRSEWVRGNFHASIVGPFTAKGYLSRTPFSVHGCRALWSPMTDDWMKIATSVPIDDSEEDVKEPWQVAPLYPEPTLFRIPSLSASLITFHLQLDGPRALLTVSQAEPRATIGDEIFQRPLRSYFCTL